MSLLGLASPKLLLVAMPLPALHTIRGLFAEGVVFMKTGMQESQLYTSAHPMSRCPGGIWAFTQDIKFDVDSHDYLITSGFESFSVFSSPPTVLESSRKSCEIPSQIGGIPREIRAQPTLEGIVRFF